MIGRSVFVCLIFCVAYGKTEDDNSTCWKHTYGRGAGYPVSVCSVGEEKSGLLCYPQCENGYTGVGPVCYQWCPDGFTDIGVTCAKPAPYGRGVGYALWNWDKCVDENKNGCERNLAMYYPKCDTGFHNVGCCICSPDCVNGMDDAGEFCTKKSYGRTAGTPMKCTDDQELDGALCYPRCSSSHKGVGPVCWASCPTGYTDCGAMCSSKGCLAAVGTKIKNHMGEIFEVAVGGALVAAGDIGGIIDVGIGGSKTIIEESTSPICQ